MTKTGMNMERVRRQNRALILKYINDNGPSSRKDIAVASGLTQASVTQIAAALIEEGILKEAGSVSSGSSAGRRQVLLKIDAEAFPAFAVNMEPDLTTAAVCDLMGMVMKGADGSPLIRQIPTEKNLPPEEALEGIAALCRELKKELPKDLRERVEAVSFAITGIVDTERGISKRAYGIWKEETDIRKILYRKLHLPVLVENNVDAFAIAEQFFGAGKTEDNLLVIKWGPGVGSSVIIDGQIFRGTYGKTAEMGHFIVDPKGALCNCGRRGCLETKVSKDALKAARSKAERSKAVDLFARSIVNAGTILAPGKIILFGSLAEEEALRSELIADCMTYDPSYHEERITHTKLSGKESYIGPAAVYTRHKFYES